MCFSGVKTIDTWDAFLHQLTRYKGSYTWVFRGQPAAPLKTSLERECDKNSIPKCARNLEDDMIKEFRRQYTGPDQDRVCKDTLYCLALMRHHGAPTRLLDWSYSPYVGFFNALESWTHDEQTGDLWCLNSDWCRKKAYNIVESIDMEWLIDHRNSEHRDDISFRLLYMSDIDILQNFVFLENPFFFNERLKIQQGVFLCPGDISRPLDDVLNKFVGNENEYNNNIIRISCKMNPVARWNALNELHRMNINRASLYPGIDGMATSLVHRLLRKYEPC
jgi:hypothetical protein